MPAIQSLSSDAGWRRLARNWNTFWFAPRDPTLLGFIRICCGSITFYTILMFGPNLEDFVGPHAWVDARSMNEVLYDRPMANVALSGRNNVPIRPTTQEEEQYVQGYYREFREVPPAPYPKTKQEANYCDQFRRQFNFDLRALALPPPTTERQKRELIEYTERWKRPMPPPYLEDDDLIADNHQYIRRHGVDSRLLYARGINTFSIWYHVQDPAASYVVHGIFVVISLLFTLGIGGRVTAFLTWFAYLNYIHRCAVGLFGVDTMITILLLYLVIGPSTAALSFDSLIARWWWKRQGGQRSAPRAAPSEWANLAVRLLQVHLCIIYFIAGLSKLQGNAWWNGTALWNVLANFEFAPMQHAWYNSTLRFLGGNQLMFDMVLTGGAYFTLAFEILYAFWIWRPSTRWLILASAILLHGVIGLFMGLQTFALIMLVMNMAFLTDAEVVWLLGPFGVEASNQPAAPARVS